MMDVLFTTRLRVYRDAPAAIKRAFDKQLSFLLENLRHPSLRAKKYDTERWQARIFLQLPAQGRFSQTVHYTQFFV
jgi:hypothetical protein